MAGVSILCPLPKTIQARSKTKMLKDNFIHIIQTHTPTHTYDSVCFVWWSDMQSQNIFNTQVNFVCQIIITYTQNHKG